MYLSPVPFLLQANLPLNQILYSEINSNDKIASKQIKINSNKKLTKIYDYYFDKFNDEFDHNPVFSRYMNNYVAANLLKAGYYFGTVQERHDSDPVVRKLRYQDIHPKYRWIFKTPRWFGYIIYQIVCLKKKIQ